MSDDNQACECKTWGRDNAGMTLLLSHHPSCQHYQPELEIRALLLRLIDGIEAWAWDVENGIHPDCWEAYCSACATVGKRIDRYTEGEDK